MSQENLLNSDIFPYDIEVIAIDLMIPWAIDISDEGKLYVTERTGSIWMMEEGRFLPEPLYTFEAPFISEGEGGLMGIALDPDFIQNRYIYVMHTYSENGRIYNRVVRLLEQDNKASIDGIVIDGIPGGSVHNGGRIKIGPDLKLYIAAGDAGEADLAQDIASLAGKILRINLDGSIPEDNPFYPSPVYSLGLRNPQGLAWSSNQTLYASDHGATGHDEINIIVPGGNYGWPVAEGEEATGEITAIRPLVQSGEETWAPSGIAVINQGPWQDNILVACLRAAQLISISLNQEGNEALNLEPWLVSSFGRLREVIESADGSIYITTSNRDGRGNPDTGDDKIIRLIPSTVA